MDQAAWRAGAEGRKAMHEWVTTSMARGGKAVHRWTTKGTGATEVPTEMVTGGKVLSSPAQLMAWRDEAWGHRWSRDGADASLIKAAMLDLKLLAADDELDDITLEQFDKACGSFKVAAGLGSDQWSPRAILALPAKGRMALAHMLRTIERVACWGWQMYVVVIGMLGKAGGGERPIGLLTMVARIWTRIRKPLASGWCSALAGFWDDAVAHHSSLRAAMRRCVQNEAAHVLGLDVANILWDAEKYYDSLSIAILAGLAKELAYPATLLRLSLLMDLGTRFLKAGRAFGNARTPSNSIIAGDGQASQKARIYVYALLQNMHDDYRCCEISQYVDDLSQRQEGEPGTIMIPIAEAAIALVNGVARAAVDCVGQECYRRQQQETRQGHSTQAH